MRAFLTLPIAAVLAMAAVPAQAGLTTENFTINAAGFSDILGGTVPPVDPASLTVSLSFDPTTGDQFDNMAGISLLASSLPISGGIAFDYDSTDDILTFGGSGLGGIGITAGTADVLAEVTSPYTGTPTFGGLLYVSSSATGIYESLAGSVQVPEPATFALFAVGLAGMAFVRRRA